MVADTCCCREEGKERRPSNAQHVGGACDERASDALEQLSTRAARGEVQSLERVRVKPAWRGVVAANRNRNTVKGALVVERIGLMVMGGTPSSERFAIAGLKGGTLCSGGMRRRGMRELHVARGESGARESI